MFTFFRHVAEHMASLTDFYRFWAPASPHTFSNTLGSISGWVDFEMNDLILKISSLESGQRDAFLTNYSSFSRKTPSAVWHSFSTTCLDS